MKFSLIVTVYNVENYIEDCLNSVVTQDLSQDEYEIICIDDGSSDSSSHKIKQFQMKYSNIKLIHQANRGVSSARNQGLLAASGEYIWFIDGDDVIAPYCLKKLYEIIKEQKLSLICFPYVTVPETFTFDCIKQTMNNQSNESRFMGNYIASVWQKIFKRSIIDEFFDENLCYGEDDEFVFPLVLKNMPVIEYPELLYYYRQRKQSITHVNTQAVNQLKLANTLARIKHFLKVKDTYTLYDSQEQMRLLKEYEYNLYAVMLIHLGKLKPWSKLQRDYFKKLKELGVYPYPIQWQRLKFNTRSYTQAMKMRKYLTEALRLFLPVRSYFFIFNCFYYLYSNCHNSIGE